MIFRSNIKVITLASLKVTLILAASACGGSGPALPEIGTQGSQDSAPEVEVTDGSSADAARSQTYSSSPIDLSPAPVIMEKENFGADIGSDSMKQEVSQCVANGYFFDRAAGVCDEQSQASEFDCSKEGIKAALILSDSEQASLKGHFAEGGELHGYMIDQCRIMQGSIRVYVVKLDENLMIVQRFLTLTN